MGLCERCSSGGAPLHNLCFRLELSDCSFYRTGDSLFLLAEAFADPAWAFLTQRPGSAIQPASLRSALDWATSAKVTLTLTMASVPSAPPLYIDCRRFQPAGSDMVADWVRGEEIGAKVESPTYAAIDLEAVRREVCSKAKLFGKAFLDVMEAEGSSELVTRTIRGAFAYVVSNPRNRFLPLTYHSRRIIPTAWSMLH